MVYLELFVYNLKFPNGIKSSHIDLYWKRKTVKKDIRENA